MSFKYALYEALKNRWIASNPEATNQQYEQAMRELAKKAGI